MSYEANVGGLAVLSHNNSNVLLDGVKVTDNHADDDIGGLVIDNTASVVTVRNSTISGNTASHNSLYEAASGVWLEAENGGNNIVEYSTISNNRITTSPDGIRQNVPGGGLFIYNRSGTTHTLRNTTISGNQAEGSGGGVKVSEPNGGQVFILHSTITNNRADSDNDGIGAGGGIEVGSSATAITIEHTIVAGNFRGTGTTRDDVSGAITAAWSLIGDSTGATITNVGGTSQIGTGAMPINSDLGPLTNNGGPTLTHLPQHDSPAIDAGDPGAVAGVGTIPGFDQRGEPSGRVVDGDADTIPRIDIGAVEAQRPGDPDCNIVGDYSRNGVVDAADYTVWRNNLGRNFTLPNEDPNTTLDLVTIEDYNVWKMHFGESCGQMGAGEVTVFDILDSATRLVDAIPRASSSDIANVVAPVVSFAVAKLPNESVPSAVSHWPATLFHQAISSRRSGGLVHRVKYDYIRDATQNSEVSTMPANLGPSTAARSPSPISPAVDTGNKGRAFHSLGTLLDNRHGSGWSVDRDKDSDAITNIDALEFAAEEMYGGPRTRISRILIKDIKGFGPPGG